MGQKINPLSLRTGTQKDWKTKTAENQNWEVGEHQDKNQQAFCFVKRFMSKNGFGVTDFRIEHRVDAVIIFVSILSLPEQKGGRVEKTGVKVLSSRTVLLNKKVMGGTPLLADFIKKGVSYIYPNKKTVVCLNYANKQLNLKNKSLKNAKKQFLTLRRYKTRNFFVEGFDTAFALTKDSKFAHALLAYLIKSIKTTKSFKPLLKFTEKSLKLLTDNPKSKTAGVRVEIRGRFNKAGRSRFFLLKVGDVPRHTRNVLLEYESGHTQNKNGSYGIKIWAVGKEKCFFNLKKQNTKS